MSVNDNKMKEETERKFENCECTHIPTSGELLYSARIRGRGHEASGIVCQDYCGYRSINDGKIIVLSVADGLGSARYEYSADGSKFAFKTLVEIIEGKSSLSSDQLLEYCTNPKFKDDFISEWTQKCAEDYKSNKKGNDVDIKSIKKLYATTFLFVLVTDSEYIIGQVGDGAILFFNSENINQKYKHHWGKFTSATDALSSLSPLATEFYISHLDKKYFNNVLLSTDGIYDRLDEGNSFVKYALNLQKRCNEGDFKHPFYWGDKDLIIYTQDDCSIVYYQRNNETENTFIQEEITNISRGLSKNPDSLVEITLERITEHVRKYRRHEGGKVTEIHVSSDLCQKSDIDPKVIENIKSFAKPFDILQFDSSDGVTFCECACPCSGEEYYPIEYLKHIGALRERKERRLPANGEEEDVSVGAAFPHTLGLNILQNISKLFSELIKIGYLPTFGFYETLLADKNGCLIFSPSLLKKTDKHENEDYAKLIDIISRDFPIIGKLSADIDGATYIRPVYPVLRDKKSFLNPKQEKENMYVLLPDNEKPIYRMANISDRDWVIDGDSKNKIPAVGRDPATNRLLAIKKVNTLELTKELKIKIDEVEYTYTPVSLKQLMRCEE